MQELNLVFIRNRRKELRLSLKHMACCMGMKNASTYLKYEKGEYLWKAEQLPSLANYLDCKITDFFNKNIAKTAI